MKKNELFSNSKDDLKKMNLLIKFHNPSWLALNKIQIHKLFTALLFLLLTLSCFSLSAQNYGDPSLLQKNKKKEIISIGAGAGVLTFQGDVGKGSQVGDYSYIRSAFSISLEKYLNRNLSVSLNVLKGKIARDEKSSDNIPKLNFESPITQIAISGTFLMQGKKEQFLIPFITAGIGFFMFNPHADLLDKNGNTYYYWGDGSTRNMPETPLNIFYAYNIDRDYKYETRLGTSSEFPHNAMVVPVSYGIKLKLTSRCDANLGFSYHFTFTDYLDYVKSKANDKYFFTYASCTWHIFKKVKTEEDKNPTVNFASIDKSDADGDGIPDLDDLCPYNPKGVLVDSKGCPIDSDNDGVPDYSDKEPHSKSGAQVNTDGIELTKEKLAELKKENITVASHSDAFSDQFNKKPSAEFLKEIAAMEIEARKNPANTSANKPIPSNLKISDWNKDGFISPEEITKTIEAFFDGSIDFSAEQIHKIIDFFFEQ